MGKLFFLNTVLFTILFSMVDASEWVVNGGTAMDVSVSLSESQQKALETLSPKSQKIAKLALKSVESVDNADPRDKDVVLRHFQLLEAGANPLPPMH